MFHDSHGDSQVRITLLSGLDAVNTHTVKHTHPQLETFGSRLKRARAAQPARGPDHKAMSQPALAELVGVKTLAVGRWEGDEREPDFRMVRLLADSLGVSVGWLVDGEGAEPAFITASAAFIPAPRYRQPEKKNNEPRRAIALPGAEVSRTGRKSARKTKGGES